MNLKCADCGKEWNVSDVAKNRKIAAGHAPPYQCPTCNRKRIERATKRANEMRNGKHE